MARRSTLLSTAAVSASTPALTLAWSQSPLLSNALSHHAGDLQCVFQQGGRMNAAALRLHAIAPREQASAVINSKTHSSALSHEPSCGISVQYGSVSESRRGIEPRRSVPPWLRSIAHPKEGSGAGGSRGRVPAVPRVPSTSAVEYRWRPLPLRIKQRSWVDATRGADMYCGLAVAMKAEPEWQQRLLASRLPLSLSSSCTSTDTDTMADVQRDTSRQQR